MNTKIKENIKGALIVPVGLSIVLIPFSILIGWILLTLLLFWFVLTPVVAFYLPTKISQNRNHLTESIIGMVIFYGIMAFMIYDHYMTDYFQIMIVSCLINFISVIVISIANGAKSPVSGAKLKDSN